MPRPADRLGYTRYWLAEHHNTGSLACTAPEIIIPQAPRVLSASASAPAASCCRTTRRSRWLRSSRLLDTLYPGRIDVGIGRRPGSDVAPRVPSPTGPAPSASSTFPSSSPTWPASSATTCQKPTPFTASAPRPTQPTTLTSSRPPPAPRALGCSAPPTLEACTPPSRAGPSPSPSSSAPRAARTSCATTRRAFSPRRLVEARGQPGRLGHLR